MIAHYGYTDAEGEFYITIDTDKCSKCLERPCIAACPSSLFVEEEEPYGDRVAGIDEAKRRRLKDECASCKPNTGASPLPCVVACPHAALRHSF